MVGVVYYIKIYPYPLNNITITPPTGSGIISDKGTYYETDILGVQTITVSADGYEPQTVTVSEDMTITLTPQEISKLSNGTDTYIIRDDVAREAINNLATVATSGSYNDLLNKPTIPTVNNATLTIQKNGSNVATFTANASSNVTANISVPNTVSSVSSSSTNADAVGAKLFYDTVGDIETALHTINSGGAATNTLTFILTGNKLSSLYELSVNNITYSYNDFTNNSLTLSFPQGTSIIWAATASGLTSVEPSSGSLTLNSDSTITINITGPGGGSIN